MFTVFKNTLKSLTKIKHPSPKLYHHTFMSKSGLSISHVRRPGLSNLAPGLAISALNKSSRLAVHISATSGPRIKYDLSIHIDVLGGAHF